MTEPAPTLRAVLDAIADHVAATGPPGLVVTSAIVAFEATDPDGGWHGSYFTLPPTSPATSAGLLTIAELALAADLDMGAHRDA